MKSEDDIYNDLIEKFITNHKDIFDEAKWCLIITLIDDESQWGGKTDVQRATKEFFEVFHKHKVDPDILIEALSVLNTHEKKEEQKSDDISEKDLTNFVDVLNKLRKKGKEDGADK